MNEEENKMQKENYKNLILDVSKIAIELGLEEDGTIDEIYSKIKEKDKQIDLMAGEIEYAGCIKKVWKCDEKNCKDCIKQYFKKLAKEKGG